MHIDTEEDAVGGEDFNGEYTDERPRRGGGREMVNYMTAAKKKMDG